MRKTICAALPVALLVLAAPVQARDHVTYRATVAPVAVQEEPAVVLSHKRHDDRKAGERAAKRRGKLRGRHHRKAAGGEVRGKAVLRDGKRLDFVKLRVRGLDRGVAYTWELRSASGPAGACSGEAVSGFRYRKLKVRPWRGGRTHAFSRGFAAEGGVSYAVVVTGPEGDVACGEFVRAGGKKRGSVDEEEAKPVGECGEDDVSEDDDVEPLAEDATYDEDEPLACDDSDGGESSDDQSGDVYGDDGDEVEPEHDEDEDF